MDVVCLHMPCVYLEASQKGEMVTQFCMSLAGKELIFNFNKVPEVLCGMCDPGPI